MTHPSTDSPAIVGRPRAVTVAACAAAVALLAGCGGGTGSAASMTPRMAISLAADRTQSVNTMGAIISIDLNGPAGSITTGTVQVQLKPSLLADENLAIVTQGQTLPLTEIVSAKAVYLKSTAFSSISALAGQTGKAWIELPLSDMSGKSAAIFSNLLQNVQNGDPLTQTRMLAASKNVRAVGRQVVDGVRTTHYEGTFSAADGLAELPASLRKQAAPMLSLITGAVTFNVWIDASHQVRMITEVETVMGETVDQSMNISSVNQPLHIALPAPSQVMVVPASSLGTASASS